MTYKEMITEKIACKEYITKEIREMRPLFGYDENTEYQKEITIIVNLSEFTEDEQKGILKIKEIELEGNYYYPTYVGITNNKIIQKDVAYA